MKGNVAVVKGAILAGCRSFYGYPITPASEILEAAAYYLPKIGGSFVQAESEIAAINMVYGAAAAGERTMTASSGPGCSLMQEGISYLAAAELPCVIVDIVRGGPGLGNLGPEQGDYNQMVKGGGHGNYKTIVLAPYSAQEMCDLTRFAFEIADRFRNPVVVFSDGFIGQMMEAVELPRTLTLPASKEWAVRGDKETRKNLLNSLYLIPEELERHVLKLEEKYEAVERAAPIWESFQTDGAEIIAVGYGIVARILKNVVKEARKAGIRLGLLRPITLWPFPSRMLATLALHPEVRGFFVVELSTGQMVDDVRLAVQATKPVHFFRRVGGMVPTVEELMERLLTISRETGNPNGKRAASAGL
ncbi:MAG: 3-methyl-2-oxobutanoate dehydrogenase subunit VorB [Deltaproteobacteria bacterium]|nr:3-methyl-2-oxobutanoate dehydrogenase subunit VorB [Deltaproteobacteria bacterium]